MENNLVTGYKLVLGYIGHMILIMGIIMLIPLLVIPFFPEERIYFFNFFISGIITIIIGIVLSKLIYKKPTGKLQKNHDAVVVVMGWIVAFIFCTLPFLFKGAYGYNFTRSLFEVVSSLTTSGITLFNVEEMAKIYLFYRSLLLFFGGMGIIIVVVSLFKESSAMNLYKAEGHHSRLLGNIRSTSRFIFFLYIFFVVAGTMAFHIFGMSIFEAMIHAVSGVATAGFSTRIDNIGYFNSLGIEITAIILMLVGATGSMTHLYLFRRKFKQVAKHNEVRTMFIILFIVITTFGLIVTFSSYELTFRQILFQTVSTLTGTAFFIVPISAIYTIIPAFFAVMLILMVFGGSSNSSSGGIKLYRVTVLFKNIKWQITDALNPGSNLKKGKYINTLDGKSYLEDNKISKMHSFVFLYFVIIFIMAMVFNIASPSENNLFTFSLFEAASILSTAGISVGIVDYYAPNIILWTSILGMFVGRLEIFVIVVCFVKISRDLKNKTVKL